MSIFQPKTKRIFKVKDLNENFVCNLCDGYLIRPVAVSECLHTFCRSCLVGLLEKAVEYRCPQCDVLIHETNPWDFIKEDKTLEDIIIKLIPGLLNSERGRRKTFYDALGMIDDENNLDINEGNLTLKENTTVQQPKENIPKPEKESNTKQSKFGLTQIGFCLNFIEPTKASNRRKLISQMKNLEKKYIRCSANVTVEHLKKYLHMKLKLPENAAVDILCNGEIMGRHHTLEFIYMTRWRFKESMLSLDYRPKLELTET